MILYTLKHVDVIMGYMTVVTKGSHRQRKVENSRVCLERHY